jgi:putative MATE family efflux protein
MNDLTQGPVGRHVVRLAAFIALAMLFQSLYFVADLYFVARFGSEAVAGVGLAGTLTFLVLGLTQALSVGALALISQAFGRKAQAEAQRIFNQALVLSVLVGLVFCVVVFAARRGYARSLAADARTADLGIQYLTWFVPALFLQFPLVILSAALRAIGDLKVPTLIQALTVLVNIALAPILMFGWGTGRPLGVAGAAIASLLSVGLGGLALVSYVRRPASPLRFDISQWAPAPRRWLAMLRIGLPAGGELGLMLVYTVVVYDVIQRFGAVAQAGFGIGFRVMQTLFLPTLAIAFAAAPIAGQSYGARLGARVRQTFYAAAAASAVIMVVLTLLCQLAPEAMVRLFSADPAVVAIGAEYLRIISWNFLATGVVFVSSSVFQGMGHTLPPLASSTLRMLLFAIPAYALSGVLDLPLRYVWYLSVATVTIQLVVNLWLLRREFARKLGPHAVAPAVAPVAPESRHRPDDAISPS